MKLIFLPFILLLNFMFVCITITSAQDKIINVNPLSDNSEIECNSRLSESNYFPLFNLTKGLTHIIRFPRNAEMDENFDFFLTEEVSSSWFSNGLLHFKPKKSEIYFHHPGYNCEGEIIYENEFQVELKTTPTKQNIVPEGGFSAAFLVEQVLLGDFCLNITNVSAPGGANAYGKFSSSQASIELEIGMMLSTGNINGAIGPNNSSSTTTAPGGAAGSDPDLLQLAGISVNDVQIIEFDFIPDQDSIKFDYVFASEEYCDFVGSFNDVFGFFLSGPGISGTFSNGAKNIALIPGTNLPVSINNVNAITNEAYYVSNAVPGSGGGGPACAEELPAATGKKNAFIQYDGFTTVLQAKSAVIPCETYHIKIAIADGGDSAFDSAVFLGQNSFISGDPGITLVTDVGYTNPIDGLATEGCSGAYIAFNKLNTIFGSLTFTLDIDNTSTATEGIDYANLPNSITMGPLVNYDTLWLDIFNDNLIEGVESIKITIGGVCECSDPFLEVFIGDPIPLVLDPIDDFGLCEPNFVTIPTAVTGGTMPYSYNWSTGSNGQQISHLFSQTGFYYLTVTDECNQTKKDTFFFELYPNYQETAQEEICEGETFFVGGGFQSLSGDYVDVLPTIYNCDSVIVTSLNVKPKSYYDTLVYSCFNTPIDVAGELLGFPGMHTITLNNSAINGCDSILQVEVTWLNPVSSIAEPDTLSCITDSVQLQIIVPNNGIGFEYLWEGPNDFVSDEASPWTNEPGTYTLTVTQTVNGVYCESFFPFSNDVEIDTLSPEIEVINDLTISCGLTDITIDPNVLNSADLDEIVFLWEGPNGFTSSNQIITVSDSGAYQLTAINPFSGCFDKIDFNILIDNIEPEIIGSDGVIGCNSDSIQIFSSVNLINGTFSWSGPNGYSSSKQNPFVYESGEYVVTYEISSACITTDTVNVLNDNTLPNLTAIGDTIICNQGTGLLSANSITSNVTYLWTGPNNFTSNKKSISVTDGGIYTIKVIGINGCVSEKDVELILLDNNPDFQVSSDTIACGEDFINLKLATSNTDLTFEWTGPSGFISNIQNPATNVPGDYSVIVTNSFGCEITETLTIDIDTLIPQVTIAKPVINCITPNPIIDVTNISQNITYSWSGPNAFNSNDQDPIISVNGTYELTILSENGCENFYSLDIPIDTLTPVLNLMGDTLDCNAGTGTISCSLSGPLYNVMWLNDMGNVIGLNYSEQVGKAGMYTMIANFKSNGCTTSKTVEVFKNDNVPDLTVLGDTINCKSSTFSVFSNSSTPGVNYNWTGPNNFTSSENNPTVVDPGTYNVTITALNGCIAIDKAIVLKDDLVPTVGINNEILNCNVPEFNIQITETGKNNQFQWTGPNSFSSNLKSPLISEAGTYSVTVTSGNGCSTAKSIIITDNFKEPSADVSASNQLDCNQLNATINTLSDAPNGSTFSWTGPNNFSASTKNIIVSDAGIYELIVMSTNGCTKSTSVTILEDFNKIGLVVQDDFIDCIWDSRTLNITYSNNNINSVKWTGPNNFSSIQLNPTITIPGQYEVLVTGNNGCTSSAEIIIDDKVQYPISTLSSEELSCENENVDILSSNMNSQFTYEWSDQASTPLINDFPFLNVNSAGFYYLTITDNSNGCAYNDSIEVKALPELLNFEFDVNNPNCNQNYGEIIFGGISGGTGPFRYSIDGGNTYQSTSEFSNLGGGDYNLVIKDDVSCELTDEVKILTLEEFEISALDLHVLVLGDDKNLTVQTSIPNSEIQSITWFPDTYLSCSDCLDPIANAVNDIVYEVTLVDKNGCELVTEIEIRVVANPIYVPNIFTPNDDNVNDLFSIFGDMQTIKSISEFSIYDRWGNLVFETSNIDPKVNTISWDGKYHSKPALEGVYAYYIVYESIRGELISLVGDVTLMR